MKLKKEKMSIKKKVALLSVSLLILTLILFVINLNKESEVITLSQSIYGIKYPDKLEISMKDYDTFLNEKNLIPFVSGKNKIRIDYVGRKYSLNEFEKMVENNIRVEKLDKKEINIGVEKSYKIENITSNKEYFVNVYAYNEGVVLKITLFTSKKDYEKDNLLLNEILSSLQLTGKPYGYLSRKFIKEWKRYSMGNIEVYYRPNGYVDTNIDIEKWTKKRVEAFNYIIDYFDLTWDYEPIKMFTFDSHLDGAEYGIEIGFCIPVTREIFATQRQSIGHEITHAITMNIGNETWIYSLLILEGVAKLFDMNEEDCDGFAKKLLRKNRDKINLVDNSFLKLKRKHRPYWLAASFVKYLLEEYGVETFKKFISQNKYAENEAFIKYYGKTGKEIEDEWKNYILEKKE